MKLFGLACRIHNLCESHNVNSLTLFTNLGTCRKLFKKNTEKESALRIKTHLKLNGQSIWKYSRLTVAYSEPCQTSKRERFVKIVNV